jgi:hypothetical protein
MACRIVFCLIVAAALAGCVDKPPETKPVEGRVVFRNGKPLANATVQFIPVSGAAGPSPIAHATTREDGAFRLQTYHNASQTTQDGAVPGKYKVVVTPYPHGARIDTKFGSPVDTPLQVEVPEAGVANLKLIVEAGRK